MKAFPKDTCLDRAERLLPHAQVLRPDRPGMFPLVVMLHGCGSPNGPQNDYARALVEAGIACVIIDSYQPRAIGRAQAVARVCTGTLLWGRERAGDLLAVLAWAKSQDWVDRERLGAVGWSHGGWTIMDALALGPEVARHAGLTDLPDHALDGLAHVSLIYPWCGPGSHTGLRGWTRPCNGLMLLAERDSVAGTRLPRHALRRARDSGADIDLHLFDGQTHSFDERQSLNPTFRYCPQSAARAIRIVKERALSDFARVAAQRGAAPIT
ncbi:MAG: prolyl oligopeptidase family serine peptidase [Hyphomonadaceae bacterium]|nr:prolyl oligopeptidase family serine peptidase [Hyphomonadaceae bacterium]